MILWELASFLKFVLLRQNQSLEYKLYSVNMCNFNRLFDSQTTLQHIYFQLAHLWCWIFVFWNGIWEHLSL